MLSVQEIKAAISQLPEAELIQLREWLDEFYAKIWDNQFEADVQAGKLDDLAAQAIKDYQAGRFKEL